MKDNDLSKKFIGDLLEDESILDVCLRKQVVTDAEKYIGQPYIYGGEGPAFDCSGFAQEALRGIGLDPKYDQNCNAMRTHFTNKKHGEVVTDRDKIRIGDLIFWPKVGYKHHVAIVSAVIGPHIQIIESAGGGKKTQNVSDAQRDSAFVRKRNLGYRGEDFEIVSPNYLLAKL